MSSAVGRNGGQPALAIGTRRTERREPSGAEGCVEGAVRRHVRDDRMLVLRGERGSGAVSQVGLSAGTDLHRWAWLAGVLRPIYVLGNAGRCLHDKHAVGAVRRVGVAVRIGAKHVKFQVEVPGVWTDL